MDRSSYNVTKCLAIGILLTTCAMSSFAQNYTLTIQDGSVYVNGKIVEHDQVPASLDTRTMNVHLSFSGTPSPTFKLDGRYYSISDRGLRDVGRADDLDNETTVVFRNAAPTQSTFIAKKYASEADMMENPKVRMQQYVFELNENARQLNAISSSLRQRQAQDLIEQVHTQAEQAAQYAQDLPYMEMQQYMVDVSRRDQALYQRLVSELELEQETRQLAMEVRAMPQGEERDLKIAQLREMLGHILDLKQENRQQEIDQLEQQLAILKQRLTEREDLKERMIERRLEELVGNPR